MNELIDFFRNLFNSSDFQPRQTCAGWWDALMYMHIGADLVIWFSYMAIPVILMYFIRKRPGLPFPHIFKLFVTFILACGMTHFLGMLAFFTPMYRLDAVVKIATALVSALTAVALIPIVPRLLALRSPEELEREIAVRKEAQAELQALNQTLELRVAERTAKLEQNTLEISEANSKLTILAADLKNALAEEARLTAILEATPDIVGTAQPTGRLSYLNKAGRKLLDIQPGEEISKYCLGDFHEKTSREVLETELIPRALKEGAWSAESTIQTRAGAQFPVSEMVLAHRETNGDVAYLSTIARDLSDIKRTEAARQKMELQVQHVQRLESLGVLAGGIAHDFNNLLMAILGNADLALKDLASEAPVRRRLIQIETTARRAADLTQQMLAYSGKGKFIIVPIDCNELIEELGALLSASISKSVEKKLVLHRPLPLIEGDPSQIRQVLMNLITNASDAIGTKPGMIVMSTSVVRATKEYFKNAYMADTEARPGPYVCLEVADTGCGMDLDTMTRMFDPFFTTKFTGRGLGLAAVLGIVRGHAGAIAVYSEVGKGTTFRVHFPVMLNSAISTVALDAVRDDSVGGGLLLVVDDDPAVRELMSDMLIAEGFDVESAVDGIDGLQKLAPICDRVRCVVLDATMPRLSGLETFTAIRKLCPNLPVLVVSGFNEELVTVHFDTQPLAHFLQKPFVGEQFVGAVKKALSR